MLKLEPFEDVTEKESPQYPTVLQGVKNNMLKFDNCVILTRVGNFYEVRLGYNNTCASAYLL